MSDPSGTPDARQTPPATGAVARPASSTLVDQAGLAPRTIEAGEVARAIGPLFRGAYGWISRHFALLLLLVMLASIVGTYFQGGATLMGHQIDNALVLGAIYALVAVGYTMVYGIIELINFAHGDVFTVSGFYAIFIARQVAPRFACVPQLRGSPAGPGHHLSAVHDRGRRDRGGDRVRGLPAAP